jgi:hypothetical protein
LFSIHCSSPSFYFPVDARIKPDLKVINAMLGCCARVEDKANGLKLLGLLVRSVRAPTPSFAPMGWLMSSFHHCHPRHTLSVTECRTSWPMTKPSSSKTASRSCEPEQRNN